MILPRDSNGWNAGFLYPGFPKGFVMKTHTKSMDFLENGKGPDTKCHISALRDRIQTNPGAGDIRRSSSTSSWHPFMILDIYFFFLRDF